MKTLRSTYCFIIGSLMAICQLQAVQAQSDSLSHRSKNALVAEMAHLIRQHGNFFGSRYDAWADTTRGLKLYVGVQVDRFGSHTESGGVYNLFNDLDWYFIDFMRPIHANELKVVGKKTDDFSIRSSRNITRKIRIGLINRGDSIPQQKASLSILFFTNINGPTTDLGQLRYRLNAIVGELTQH